ncbi:tetratricopeptide repeat protein [Cyanobacteria bacterium FACHB-DQ100]|uniref:tetratricopeptide repeat protein n=1 Tax=unclassified Leptolyngbya TaxID=2650499 RepID=UPI00167FF261|nr:tetratricopeptide repeat protein [Leptolyngbya sp. FACHB-17]MBD1824557.1 tetratricopeptide repeat protein [Cyanobacteria bacterium FACHB-DQ100]MBD2080824.1 tetratricopeptide repeat protein [Leptolyngbya sp. FACHB-17]
MNGRTFLDGKQSKQRTVNVGRANAVSRRSLKADRSLPKKSTRSQTVWLDPVAQDRLLRQQSLTDAKQGHYLEAIAGLTILIDRNPENATDYNNRGLVHFQCGHLDAAIEDYNKAIRLNSKLASAYNNRANYYASQGLLIEAITDYDRAIDLDPTNIRAWLNQGITFRDLELYSQAIENFEQALQITQLLSSPLNDHSVLEAHLYGARGRAHHLAGDWNFAIADYYRALERIPEADIAEKRLRMQVNRWMQELTN